MPNDHGYLPKIDELTPKNQHRLDTWYDKAYTDDNLFRTLANNDDVLSMFMDWVRTVYSGSSGLDTHMVELCRIRLANQNECFH